ncbi:magnesium-dependent phosphatase 1-like isoform X2 [Diaphorina citri]|uniref:Magnesium-dependent phosphatase 1-like isoform X1 n=1 Tax=Diaphorina citri TaxID=121845 RepID=A0A1S3DB84_DIACI|nr:magnesium-dependent phosphatase 1-like isoform X1 [Diaphorina citri]XP_026683752.1 magnesium-dependent phosphatase 1-like isoform X2 [Diaphorina citri]
MSKIYLVYLFLLVILHMTNQNFAQSRFDHFPEHKLPQEMSPQSNSLDPSVKKFPKMVVFDLDYTLWPLHVHDLVAPFKKIGQKVMDAKGTLIKYYRGVPEILRYLKENKCLVAAASRTSEILHAKQILNLINLNQYFSNKEIYPGPKTTHFESLKKATGIEYKDMVFFDDEERNSHDVSPLGVTCIHVKKGMSHAVLQKGLKQWASKN